MRFFAFLCLLTGFTASSLGQSYSVTNLSDLTWTLTSHNVSVPGKVPSQAHLDLFAAGVISDPLYGFNDYDQAWVAYSNFTYTSTSVGNLSRAAGVSTILVFDGLDTIADVFFCEQQIGSTNNQFRKWTFDVSDLLGNCSSTPNIRVAFTSAPLVSAQLEQLAYNQSIGLCIECVGTQYQFPGRQFIRKEQSDYGWDWAPGYSPQGIWKDGRVIQVSTRPGNVEVEGLFVDTYRNGQVNNLPPDQNAPFVFNASIDYIGTLPNQTMMYAQIVDSSGRTFWQGALQNVKQTQSSVTGSVILPTEPDLWWPAGHGNQTMYLVTVSIGSPSKTASFSNTTTLASAQRRIGFRTLVLNQLPVSLEQIAEGVNIGDNWHFEINGHEVYAKGSNFVPPDPFWPRITRSDVEVIFMSAAAANMNMLRVWSSGIYVPDFVYDLADEYGLMLWSELQFSDGIYRTDEHFVDNLVAEVAENVRRVNHHPSLALWCGGNEHQIFLQVILLTATLSYLEALGIYNDVYLDKLLHAVFNNTRSISYIGGSSTSGVLLYDYYLPLPVVERQGPLLNFGPTYGVSEFYNYDAPSLSKQSTYNPSLDSPLNSRFVDEFGFHSHPSYETYAAVVPASELYFNSSMMIHRNRHYAVDVTINSVIGNGTGGPTPNVNGSLSGLGQMSIAAEYYYPIPHSQDQETLFRLQIYATQLFQAELVRYEIDLYRRASGLPIRNLGSLYWMLDDIWAAPTWASLEVGGRWKMLHHIAQDVYSPVIIAPFVDDTTDIFSISVTSDRWQSVSGTASLTWYDWSGTRINATTSISDWTFDNKPVSVSAIHSTQIFSNIFDLLPSTLKTAVAILRTNVTGDDGTSYTAERFFVPQFLSTNSSIQAFRDPQLNLTYDPSQDVFVLQSQAIAAFVWLSQPLAAKGYFSKNGFWMLPGQTTLRFVPFAGQGQPPTGWQNDVTVLSVWDLTT